MSILTAVEAQDFLRLDAAHSVVTLILPVIDATIQTATGTDWAADATKDPLAKAAALLLLAPWFDDPAALGDTALGGRGFDLVIGQLQAKALLRKESVLPREDLALVGSFPTDGLDEISINIAPRLVFNHVMVNDALLGVTLETAAGVSVATTNTLDGTHKLITVTPDDPLAAGNQYVLYLSAVADEYGGTISTEISFTTVE